MTLRNLKVRREGDKFGGKWKKEKQRKERETCYVYFTLHLGGGTYLATNLFLV